MLPACPFVSRPFCKFEEGSLWPCPCWGLCAGEGRSLELGIEGSEHAMLCTAVVELWNQLYILGDVCCQKHEPKREQHVESAETEECLIISIVGWYCLADRVMRESYPISSNPIQCESKFKSKPYLVLPDPILSDYLCIYLSINQAIYPPSNPAIYLSTCQSIYPA